MSLSVVVGHKHDRVGYDCTWHTGGKTSPKSLKSSIITINMLSTLDHTTIWHKRMILFELHRYLAYLKFSFDDILRIRYQPCKETSNSTSNQLGYYSKLLGILQAIDSDK